MPGSSREDGDPAGRRSSPSIGQRLAFNGYRAGSVVARAIPRPLLPPMRRVLATVMYRAATGRRRMVERHLQRVHGRPMEGAELRREVQRAFDSYARYWVESFRVPAMSGEEIDSAMTAEGLEHLEAAKAAGNGAILALPHLGSWDYGGAWLARNGYPLTVVVEPLDPPELLEWFADLRQGLGMEVVPLGLSASTAVMRTLRANGYVALLSDRDIAGGGVEVEFFGERTTLPAGPATIAIRTGAALLPTTVYHVGEDHHRGVVRPPIDCTRRGSLRDDVARITQVLADELADLIRGAPEQWHVFQPNWPSDRE
ncbi:MAG TPA: phosphatidylinositol mannoside acyltransferase [Acidimicrobiales bacterium]|nr:phosphatidylinositol mannoside acyltransferase [Acidimicrobiales bacterium]